MAQQLSTTTENNFTKGLITEATGLNFPENAATDTDNCIYTLIGDVTRREGIDYETNFGINPVTTGVAFNSYKWNNAGGDGETQLVVVQNGSTLQFYLSTHARLSKPLSQQILSSTVNVSVFTAPGDVFDPTVECQFSDGNGYLFVYHPNCDPFFCSLAAFVVTATKINVQIRDFVGANEPNVAINSRPTTLTNEHLYNLVNQGWTQGAPYAIFANVIGSGGAGNQSFFVGTGYPVTLGDLVNLINTQPFNTGAPGGFFPAGSIVMSGTVNGYSGGTLTVNITSVAPGFVGQTWGGFWEFTPYNQGYINTWHTDIGNYPSNADQWWSFKDNTGLFNPTTTVNNVTLNSGPAPSGHFVLSAWDLDRSLASAVSGITVVATPVRPRTGTWFQGRVWYAGVDASQPATGDVNFYTWTENIYFSQIVETPSDFGSCYQTNDPTAEDLFDLLPTDGGVITIQGAGAIYKLFPIQNGMLVFAANGVWFITGSQGIGFSANDYTITKISSVTSISSTSFVDVLGLPYFWNEDGIYSVQPQQSGGLSVNPITVGTIETFYDNIPTSSKVYARAAYHPIDYVIQWVYCTQEADTDVTARYSFDGVLNFNTYNKAFYPYTVSNTSPSISGIVYVSNPGGASAPNPVFKYPTVTPTGLTFSEEHDTNYVDWESSGTSDNYVSYFVTGYKLRGQGIKKFQPQYIQVYSRQNGAMSSYKIQGIWDYANDPSSGRWSSLQLVTNGLTRFDTVFRRHKIRGHGYVLQFKIQSVDGVPFDIQGWATVDTTNTGA